MNNASINNGVFAPSAGAGLPFSGLSQSENSNEFQALFKAHLLGENSAEQKVESRTMAFGMRRRDVNPFIETARLNSRPASFSEQFQRASQVSERANTNKSQETAASTEKNSGYSSQPKAEDMATMSEQSDKSAKKLPESNVGQSEKDTVIKALMKEDLATEDQSKLVELFAMLEEKIEELTENGELEEEVAAKLAALVAELQKISESVAVDAKASEKLVELANSLLEQLAETDTRDKLSQVVQQSNSMNEVASAVLENSTSKSDTDYLKNFPELQKAFAAAEKATDSKLTQAADISDETTDEMLTETADDGDNKTSLGQSDSNESKRKSISESKHEKTTNESKNAEQANRQNGANETAQPSLRQKHEMLNDGEEISQEVSGTVEASASGTSENTTSQQTVSAEKAEVVAQSVAKHSIDQKSDNSQDKDALSAKKVESSLSGNTATESSNQKSDSGAGNNNGQGLASGSNYNSSGLASAKSATPQINHAHFAELLEKAELLKTNNGKQILSLEMTPDELGKLEMELTSKDGILTARISAENTLARAKLEEMASQIKENLLEQGINLTEITVDISSKNPDEQERSAMFDRKNKSKHGSISDVSNKEEVIRKNILPNLRRAALNIKAVDLTV